MVIELCVDDGNVFSEACQQDGITVGKRSHTHPLTGYWLSRRIIDQTCLHQTKWGFSQQGRKGH